MIDINDVNFAVYATEYADEAGYVVDPKSDEKEVFIPSPPTKVMVKTNPRTGIILLTEKPIGEEYERLDELKACAKEKKLFIACVADNSTEALEATYQYMSHQAKNLNVKKDDIQVNYMGNMAQIAQDFVDYVVDEMDEEVEDAEEFEF